MVRGIVIGHFFSVNIRKGNMILCLEDFIVLEMELLLFSFPGEVA